MPVNIHIEHLIVEGAPFAASDGPAFRAALERELTARAAEHGDAPWQDTRRTSVQAPAISPALPGINAWAAASARSLCEAIRPIPK